MKAFEVGKSYSVFRLDDRAETVTIAARDGNMITLTDGRKVRAIKCLGPAEEDAETLRLDEVGCFARGGVVRVCHEVQALTQEAA